MFFGERPGKRKEGRKKFITIERNNNNLFT